MNWRKLLVDIGIDTITDLANAGDLDDINREAAESINSYCLRVLGKEALLPRGRHIVLDDGFDVPGEDWGTIFLRGKAFWLHYSWLANGAKCTIKTRWFAKGLQKGPLDTKTVIEPS